MVRAWGQRLLHCTKRPLHVCLHYVNSTLTTAACEANLSSRMLTHELEITCWQTFKRLERINLASYFSNYFGFSKVVGGHA